MGMDLHLADSDAGSLVTYNWGGWEMLIGYLRQWGVDTTEFLLVNDGDEISAATCRWVSHAIADHFDELPPDYQARLMGHAEIWSLLADSGGALQK